MLSSAVTHLPAGVTVTESVTFFNLPNKRVKFVTKYYRLNDSDIVETLTVSESEAGGAFRVVYHGEVLTFPDIESALRADNLYPLQCGNFTYQRVFRYPNEQFQSQPFPGPSPQTTSILQPQLAYAIPPLVIRASPRPPSIFVPTSPPLYPQMQSPILYSLTPPPAVIPTMVNSSITATTPCLIRGPRGPRPINPRCVVPNQRLHYPVYPTAMSPPIFATTACPNRISTPNVIPNAHAYSMIVPSNMHVSYTVPPTCGSVSSNPL